MKKLISVLVVMIMLLVGSLSSDADRISLRMDKREHLPKVFYLVPHQDDELLTFGPSILNHMKGNNDVHLVLLTDGSGTGAFKKINNRLAAEGKPTITKSELVDARNREFRQSAMILGVDASKIMTYDFTDGTLTKGNVKQVIQDILAIYPEARFKTTSYLDEHRDHKAAGEALLEAYESGLVTDARFYLKTTQFGTGKLPGTLYIRNEAFVPFLNAGYEIYGYWNPEVGRYSVGHISTKYSFDMMKKDYGVKYHIPGYGR